MKYIEAKCAFCRKDVVRKAQARSANVRIHFCNLGCKAEFQKLSKPVTRDWLYEQYVTLRRNCPDIGREVKRDAKSVWNWLKDFGIPTRGRGSESAGNLIHERGEKATFFGKNHTLETRQKMRKARLKDGHVPYLKNGVHWLKGVRGKDHPCWKGGSTPERQAVYGSTAWRRAVKAVWARDEKTCQRCGEVHAKGKPFDVHHSISFIVKEMRLELTNLVLLCEPCHYWVHSRKNLDKRFLKCPSLNKK